MSASRAFWDAIDQKRRARKLAELVDVAGIDYDEPDGCDDDEMDDRDDQVGDELADREDDLEWANEPIPMPDGEFD